MKYIFSLLLLLCISCNVSGTFNNPNTDRPSQLIGPIFSRYGKKVAKQRGYTVAGTGASMPNWNVKYLSMSFEGKDKVDIPEGRRLYVELVAGLVDEINANLTIRPYLATYPATWKNTEIDIDFIGKETPEKNISLIAHVNDRIFYSIYDQTKKQFVTIFSEPYEEALQILKNENENNK